MAAIVSFSVAHDKGTMPIDSQPPPPPLQKYIYARFQGISPEIRFIKIDKIKVVVIASFSIAYKNGQCQ